MRSWLTSGVGALTEQTYDFESGRYTVYGGYHPDVGSAGFKTVGLSAPSGQKWATAAVEVTGT
jgi:hypothetical protein